MTRKTQGVYDLVQLALFTDILEKAAIQISMDGKGRALDNIFIERLWRSVKYEDIYLNHYDTVPALFRGLDAYFSFYNQQRPHQSLGYQTPAALYWNRPTGPL